MGLHPYAPTGSAGPVSQDVGIRLFFQFIIERNPRGDPQSGGAGYRPGSFVPTESAAARTRKAGRLGAKRPVGRPLFPHYIE